MFARSSIISLIITYFILQFQKVYSQHAYNCTPPQVLLLPDFTCINSTSCLNHTSAAGHDGVLTKFGGILTEDVCINCIDLTTNCTGCMEGNFTLNNSTQITVISCNQCPTSLGYYFEYGNWSVEPCSLNTSIGNSAFCDCTLETMLDENMVDQPIMCHGNKDGYSILPDSHTCLLCESLYNSSMPTNGGIKSCNLTDVIEYYCDPDSTNTSNIRVLNQALDKCDFCSNYYPTGEKNGVNIIPHCLDTSGACDDDIQGCNSGFKTCEDNFTLDATSTYCIACDNTTGHYWDNNSSTCFNCSQWNTGTLSYCSICNSTDCVEYKCKNETIQVLDDTGLECITCDSIFCQTGNCIIDPSDASKLVCSDGQCITDYIYIEDDKTCKTCNETYGKTTYTCLTCNTTQCTNCSDTVTNTADQPVDDDDGSCVSCGDKFSAENITCTICNSTECLSCEDTFNASIKYPFDSDNNKCHTNCSSFDNSGVECEACDMTNCTLCKESYLDSAGGQCPNQTCNQLYGISNQSNCSSCNSTDCITCAHPTNASLDDRLFKHQNKTCIDCPQCEQNSPGPSYCSSDDANDTIVRCSQICSEGHVIDNRTQNWTSGSRVCIPIADCNETNQTIDSNQICNSCPFGGNDTSCHEKCSDFDAGCEDSNCTTTLLQCDVDGCKSGYYFNNVTNKCTACLANCTDCDDNTTCNQCLSSLYVFTNATNSIISCMSEGDCGEGGLVVNTTHCFDCKTVYTTCKTCNNDTGCIECNEGEKINQTNYECTSDCGDDFGVVMNHTINENCLQCNVTNCKSCTGIEPSACTLCKTDYYLTDTFDCVDNANCTNSKAGYTNATHCLSCSEINADCIECEEGKCLKCSGTKIPQLLGDDSYNCVETIICTSESYIDNSTSNVQCKNCSENITDCKTCSFSASNLKCDTCNSPKIINEDSAISTSCITNQSCIDDASSYIDNSSSHCVPNCSETTPNCKTCQETSDCFECDDTYALQNDGGSISCILQNTCTENFTDFVANNDNNVNECYKCNDNSKGYDDDCSYCNNGNCISCGNSKFLDSTDKKCIASCSEYDNYETLNSVDNSTKDCNPCSDLSLESGTCSECSGSSPENCLKCDEAQAFILWVDDSNKFNCIKNDTCTDNRFINNQTDDATSVEAQHCRYCNLSNPNCENCTGKLVCTACETQFYHLDDTASPNVTCKLCSESITNCQQCTDAKTCIQCDAEYYLNTKDDIVECISAANCSNAPEYNNLITGTSDGYGTCESCVSHTENSIDNCVRCSRRNQTDGESDFLCEGCDGGFWVHYLQLECIDYCAPEVQYQHGLSDVDNSLGRCYECDTGPNKVINCHKCSYNGITCKECDTGFTIKEDNTCNDCSSIDNCEECDDYQELRGYALCIKCASGFYYHPDSNTCTNVCDGAAADNLTQWVWNDGKHDICESCSHEKILASGECDKCKRSNDQILIQLPQCLSCSGNKYFVPEKQTCVEECEFATEFIQLEAGDPDKKGQCISCKLKDSNCLYCSQDNGVCKECEENYVIGTTGICKTQCETSAFRDILNKTCLSECPTKQFGQNANGGDPAMCKFCTELDANCDTCSKDKCLNCKSDSNTFISTVNFACLSSKPKDQYFDSTNSVYRQCGTNCDECENSTSCSDCKKDTYTQSGPNCDGVCPADCDDCEYDTVNSKVVCAQCQTNKILKGTNCVSSCDPNQYYNTSLLAAGTAVCTDCNTTYPNSATCDQDNVLTCTAPYLLSNDTLQCIDQCPADEYVFNNVTCKKCSDISDCEECSDSSTCTKCSGDYTLKADGTCAYCEDIDPVNLLHCKKGKCVIDAGGNSCTECKENYTLTIDQSTCLKCSDEITGCQDTFCSGNKNDMECSICEQSDQQLSLDKKSCFSCSETAAGANCATCDSSKNCQSCKTDYVLTTDGSECYQCSQTAAGANCTTCDGDKNCLSCASGLILTADSLECFTCDVEVPNCKQCNNDKTCSECNESFFLEDSTTCTACLSNCTKCNNTNSCIECTTDHHLSLNKTKCEYDFDQACIEELQFVELIDDQHKTCQTCDKKAGHNLCLKCQKDGTCYECKEGYFTLSTFNVEVNNDECQLCHEGIENCIACPNDALSSTYLDCQECKPGFRLQSNECFACKPGCEQCTASKCNKCFDGNLLYLQIEDTCSPCSSNEQGHKATVESVERCSLLPVQSDSPSEVTIESDEEFTYATATNLCQQSQGQPIDEFTVYWVQTLRADKYKDTGYATIRDKLGSNSRTDVTYDEDSVIYGKDSDNLFKSKTQSGKNYTIFYFCSNQFNAVSEQSYELKFETPGQIKESVVTAVTVSGTITDQQRSDILCQMEDQLGLAGKNLVSDQLGNTCQRGEVNQLRNLQDASTDQNSMVITIKPDPYSAESVNPAEQIKAIIDKPEFTEEFVKGGNFDYLESAQAFIKDPEQVPIKPYFALTQAIDAAITNTTAQFVLRVINTDSVIVVGWNTLSFQPSSKAELKQNMNYTILTSAKNIPKEFTIKDLDQNTKYYMFFQAEVPTGETVSDMYSITFTTKAYSVPTIFSPINIFNLLILVLLSILITQL